MGACVLHLTNLKFKPDGDGSAPEDMEVISTVAHLLGVPASDLAESLTVKYNVIMRERIRMPLPPEKAKHACDALGKALYSRQFEYIVEHINKSLAKGVRKGPDAQYIGVLDIF